MYSTEDVSLLALITKSAPAQQALYGIGDFLLHLLDNPTLHPALWEHIYTKDCANNAALRTTLLHNAPTPAQARMVLIEPDEEVRLEALAAGVGNLQLSAISELMAKPYFSDAYAHALIKSKQIPSDLALSLWNSTKASKELDFDSDESENLDLLITHYGLLTDQEVLDVLKRPEDLLYFLTRAMDCRPTLLTLVRTAPNPQRYYAAAATSRHLSPEFADEIANYLIAKSPDLTESDLDALMQLSENIWVPSQTRLRCAHTLVNEAPREVVIHKIHSSHKARSLERWRKVIENLHASVKLGEDQPMVNPTLTQLQLNELSAQDLDEIFYAVEKLGGYNFPTLHKVLGLTYDSYQLVDSSDTAYEEELPADLADQVLIPTLDPLGVQGWRLFLDLLLDWQGEIQELLSVVQSTTKR